MSRVLMKRAHELTTTSMAHCMGRSVTAFVKLRNNHASFPRPRVYGNSLFWNPETIRAWIVKHQSENPKNPKDIPVDLEAFDARVAMALAESNE